MNWMALLIAAIICVICAVLGLTAGINLNPASTVSFVWDWSIAGSWVSGVGALLAVLASLWLSGRGERIQAEREKEKLRIEVSVAGIFAHLDIVSLGHYPVTVRAVLIGKTGQGAFAIPLRGASGEKIAFPRRLGFRDDIHASWRADQAKQLLDIISLLQPFTLRELTIEVVTTVEIHIVPADSNFIVWLQDAANRHGVRLLSPN